MANLLGTSSMASQTRIQSLPSSREGRKRLAMTGDSAGAWRVGSVPVLHTLTLDHRTVIRILSQRRLRIVLVSCASELPLVYATQELNRASLAGVKKK